MKPPPLAPPADAFGPKLWDWTLLFVIELARARAAFVLDDQGLLVASRGKLPFEEIEGVGARLMLALDQAAAMAPGQEPAVNIEIDRTWLTGLRVEAEGGAAVVVGILSMGPVRGEVRAAVAERIRSSLSR